MDLMQWLTTDLNGEFVLTLLVSMVPVIELRGGIPFGVAAGLPVWAAYLAAVIGNLIPVPFIVVYIRRIFMFMRQHMPRLNSLLLHLVHQAVEPGHMLPHFHVYAPAYAPAQQPGGQDGAEGPSEKRLSAQVPVLGVGHLCGYSAAWNRSLDRGLGGSVPGHALK